MEKCDFTTSYPICIEWKHPSKVHSIDQKKHPCTHSFPIYTVPILSIFIFSYLFILYKKQDRNKVK